MQAALLRNVVAAAGRNRFYSDFYRRAGVDPARISRTFDIRQLPIVRKADILADLAAAPPFGRRLSVPSSEICNIVESSGTSGNAAEVQALTENDLESVLDAEAVGFTWAGAGRGTVVAVNAPVGMTAAGCWWHLTLYRLRCNVLRLAGMDTSRRLSYLQRYGANQLLVGAHYMRRMTHVAQAEGYDLAKDFRALDAIFVGGGGWTVNMAEEWADQWQARIYEQYGNSQRCLAWTCERGAVHRGQAGVVHGLPHTCLMEVVDPATGEWVDDGAAGEVVITLLSQQAMPLVRYGTGDRAIRRRGSSCGCGREFDGIEAGSVSRLDGMLRVRGTNLWPDVVHATVVAHRGVLDYRVEVRRDAQAREQITLIADVPLATSDSEHERLEQDLASQLKIATRLSIDVCCRVIDADEIRSTVADGKPRRWHDLRQIT